MRNIKVCSTSCVDLKINSLSCNKSRTVPIHPGQCSIWGVGGGIVCIEPQQEVCADFSCPFSTLSSLGKKDAVNQADVLSPFPLCFPSSFCSCPPFHFPSCYLILASHPLLLNSHPPVLKLAFHLVFLFCSSSCLPVHKLTSHLFLPPHAYLSSCLFVLKQ